MKALLESLDKEPGPGGYKNASTDYVAFPRYDGLLHAGLAQAAAARARLTMPQP